MAFIVLPWNFQPNDLIDATKWMANLNAILGQVNGGLDNTNIKSGANIATAKLATDAGITAGMIALNTITGAQIANGSILVGDLAAKASVYQLAIGNVTPNLAVGTVATPLCSVGWTSRGGYVVLAANIWGFLFGQGGTGQITFSLWRDGTIYANVVVTTFGLVSSSQVIDIPNPFLFFIDSAVPVGAHTWTFYAQVSGTNANVVTATPVGGIMWGVELA